MMNYHQLNKNQLEDILENVSIKVIGSGSWLDAFPQVTGFNRFIPDSYADEIESLDSFRSSDHAIAHKMAQYPEFREIMAKIVEIIIQKNKSETEPYLANISEHAGTHFATELALSEKQYIKLYADFLCSNDLHYERYQSFDFIRIVKHWGWNYETYYLLFARWFAGGDNYEDDINYINYCICDLRKDRFDTPEEANKLLAALGSFLESLEYDVNDRELNQYIAERFEKLVQNHIYHPCNFAFSENAEKAKKLISRFSEVIEKLQNPIHLANSDSNGLRQIENKEKDLPEI